MSYTLQETLLKLENIGLTFGKHQVLRDINLEIKNIVRNEFTGQVVTLLGRSGVGKTQLFKMIAGLTKPSIGNVWVGKEQLPVKPGMVGMVLQDYPLFGHRTVQSNMELVSDDKSKIAEYLNEFDILDCKDKYSTQLSGGQRQRAAIVQQLLCSDSFILLDEPFSGLDPVATEKLCKNIAKVANHKDENTVIISSHILEPSIAISDSVYMLGYLYDDDKNKIPGAMIKYFYDLAAVGLAWNPEIRKDPRFNSIVEDIRQLFKTL